MVHNIVIKETGGHLHNLLVIDICAFFYFFRIIWLEAKKRKRSSSYPTKEKIFFFLCAKVQKIKEKCILEKFFFFILESVKNKPFINV